MLYRFHTLHCFDTELNHEEGVEVDSRVECGMYSVDFHLGVGVGSPS